MRLCAFVCAALIFAPQADACECAPKPPPCQAIGMAELVFLGTVTEVSSKDGSVRDARMHIDRVFKGKLEADVDLFDDGMCDGPHLEVGHQYLMYISKRFGAKMNARGCTRSRAVEYAEEDLAFLKEYSKGKTTTSISGTVLFRPDDEWAEKDRTPLKGVEVTVALGDQERSTATDASGAYSFRNLPPGEYEIFGELPGYRLNWAPRSVALRANGCAQANLLMKVDRRVHGVVTNKRGEPVRGVRVDLQAKSESRATRYAYTSSSSTEDGSYAIDGIPPGQYYLGINLRDSPTKEHPHPRLFFPNTTDRTQAVEITIVTGATTQQFDLRTEDPLPLITVMGRIVKLDGKVPTAQENPTVQIRGPKLSRQIDQESIVIDAESRFQVKLCDGIGYSAFAFAGPIASAIHSAPIEFTVTKDLKLEFVLDKSDDEFQKLYKAAEQ